MQSHAASSQCGPGRNPVVTLEERKLVRYRLQRAQEALDEAALLHEKGHLNACVNRLYYAGFYAVSALLLAEGKSSSKHSGIRALFTKEWVKKVYGNGDFPCGGSHTGTVNRGKRSPFTQRSSGIHHSSPFSLRPYRFFPSFLILHSLQPHLAQCRNMSLQYYWGFDRDSLFVNFQRELWIDPQYFRRLGSGFGFFA